MTAELSWIGENRVQAAVCVRSPLISTPIAITSGYEGKVIGIAGRRRAWI